MSAAEASASASAYASAVAAAALLGYGGEEASGDAAWYGGGGFEDAEAGGGGNYYVDYAAAGEATTEYIVDETIANAVEATEMGPRVEGENVAGGRYVRFVRSGGGAGGVTATATPIGGRSIFEELNASVPENVALPAPEAITIFDVPLNFFRSRPWDEPGVDRDAYFNYALDSRTFSQYALRQQRVRSELTHIIAARTTAANIATQNANPQMAQMAAIAQQQYQHNMLTHQVAAAQQQLQQ